jgi:phage protein D
MTRPMTKLMTISRVACLTGALAAGAMMVRVDIASAKVISHQSSDARSTKTNSSHSSSAKEKREKHESKEHKDHKDHEAKHCGKNCKGAPKATPVTISNGVGKTKIKVGPTEVLGLSAKNGTITVTEFTGKPGLRTVTFGGNSITLSSSVADGLRLRGSNGKSLNIEIDNTVSVKQNANGSVTVTANPPPLKGL